MYVPLVPRINRKSYRLETAPAEEPVSVEEAKVYLKEDGGDDLPLNFHPAAIRASVIDTPCGAG
jgi:hypothetical protein